MKAVWNNATLAESDSKLQELIQENNRFRRRQSGYKYSLPFPWVASALGVCLLAGFLLGIWVVDYRSRKRHGGIRIH